MDSAFYNGLFFIKNWWQLKLVKIASWIIETYWSKIFKKSYKFNENESEICTGIDEKQQNIRSFTNILKIIITNVGWCKFK